MQFYSSISISPDDDADDDDDAVDDSVGGDGADGDCYCDVRCGSSS